MNIIDLHEVECIYGIYIVIKDINIYRQQYNIVYPAAEHCACRYTCTCSSNFMIGCTPILYKNICLYLKQIYHNKSLHVHTTIRAKPAGFSYKECIHNM